LSRNLKARIARLEKHLVPPSNKHLLNVFVSDGETEDEALDRDIAARGITLDDVGHVVFWPRGTERDYGNHNGVDTLIGHTWLADLLREIDGTSRGLPDASRLPPLPDDPAP
jgi:hypothetical protein